MYALIEKQTNAILKVGTEFVELSDAKPFYWLECDNNVSTAWTYDGVKFIPPIIQTDQNTVFNVTRITGSQMRQQLILDGNDDKVQSAIDEIPDLIMRKLIQARYEYETIFVLDEPNLIMLSSSIGYNTPDLRQDFFNRASQI